jgi:cyclopropane fatty-acyl-phospholipid synthase-like methyltransferase
MLLDTVRKLIGWRVSATEAQFAVPPTLLLPEIAIAEDDDPVWPSARIGIVEALWGKGFLSPGGEAETLRLAKPMGLSAASSLLLLGTGSGGPTRSIAANLGVWVSGFEANPRLASLANERSVRAGLGRRAQVETWDPLAPKFPPHYYHHGVALEPLRGARPEPTLAAISLALKPGGQLVLVELVADAKLDANDPMTTTWARLDHRPPDVPSELTITRVLGRLGFDVRIVEDISGRHMRQSVAGWRTAVRAMEDTRPALHELALVVREAELWLARFRLMRAGRLRLVRWHAIGRGGIEPPPG